MDKAARKRQRFFAARLGVDECVAPDDGHDEGSPQTHLTAHCASASSAGALTHENLHNSENSSGIPFELDSSFWEGPRECRAPDAPTSHSSSHQAQYPHHSLLEPAELSVLERRLEGWECTPSLEHTKPGAIFDNSQGSWGTPVPDKPTPPGVNRGQQGSTEEPTPLQDHLGQRGWGGSSGPGDTPSRGAVSRKSFAEEPPSSALVASQKRQLPDAGEFSLSRRRRDFTEDGYVGLELNGWVTLGEDLWEKGVTLGLEKFLPSTLEGDIWQQRMALPAEERDKALQCRDDLPQDKPVTTGDNNQHSSIAPSPSRLRSTINRLSPGHPTAFPNRQLLPRRIPDDGQLAGEISASGSSLAWRLATVTAASGAGIEKQVVEVWHTPAVRCLRRQGCSPGEQVDHRQHGQHGQQRGSPGEQPLVSMPWKVLPMMSGQQAHIKSLLLLAANALERRDTAQFKNLTSKLHSFVKQRGRGWERAAFSLLQSLHLRHEGEGPTVLKRRLRLSIKEMVESIMWMFVNLPLCPFAVICTVGTFLPVLVGKPRVHILNFGEALVPELSNLLRLLCQSTGGSRLQSFHLTHVRAFPLCRPGRPEWETFQLPEVVASMLHSTAETLGVKFSFQGILLKETGLSLLDRVQRSPGEVVGVCMGAELKFFSEELAGHEGSALEKLKNCITRLQPDILCAVEDNVGASCQDFLARFANWQEFMVAMYEASDACTRPKDLKLMHNWENMYWRCVCRSVVGCEGSERRWRPRSGEEQEEIFSSCGLEQVRVCGSILEREQDMISECPEGWAVMEERQGLTLSFRGTRLVRATSWKWPH